MEVSIPHPRIRRKGKEMRGLCKASGSDKISQLSTIGAARLSSQEPATRHLVFDNIAQRAFDARDCYKHSGDLKAYPQGDRHFIGLHTNAEDWGTTHLECCELGSPGSYHHQVVPGDLECASPSD
jgi:hypothetical protein